MTDTHVEQIKYTDHAGCSVNVGVLMRLKEDADRAGKENRFVIDFERYGIRLVGTVEDL